MSRAKTQNPAKPNRKRLATPPQLGPIDEADVDAAFAGIRLESEPAVSSKPPEVLIDKDADAAAAAAAIADLSMDDDIPIEVESGSDFAPDLSDLAEVKKADSPTRRARTQPAEASIEESQPIPKRGPPKPPPGKKPEVAAAPKPAPAKIPSILSKVKAAVTATGPSPIVSPVASQPATATPPAAPLSTAPPPTPPPAVARPVTAAPIATKPLLAPATGGASIGRIAVSTPKPASAKNTTGPATRAETVGAGTQIGANPIRMPATIPDAPPTIVTPNPLGARPATPHDPPPLAPPPRADSVVDLVTRKSEPHIVPLEQRKSAPAMATPTPVPVQTIDLEPDDFDVVEERFPRGESAVIEAPAYVPPKRAKRATSDGDYDYGADEDAMTSADLAAKLRDQNQGPPRPPSEAEPPRAGSYLEYALRAGLPRKIETEAPTEPPARDSEMKIEPVPTKVLDAALRFDSEPKSDVGIQPVPTKVLDAALRFDSEPSAKSEPPKPAPKAPLPPPRTDLAVPKLALRDSLPAIGKVDTRVLEHALRPESEPAIVVSRAESEFDYSSLALDHDGSGRMVVESVPRANSELERALRESSSSIDMDAPVDEESGDFGDVIAPLRTMQLGDREPSVSDGPAFDVAEVAETPILQLAVYETGANLQAAAAAITTAGHAITASTSERDGLERIGIAMADGHIDAVLVGIPGGEVLIKAALSLAPWGPIVIASCDGRAGDAVRQANAAGADLVAIRPHDAERLGPVLLAAARILEQRRDMMAAQQGREEELLSRLDSDGESEVGGLLSFDAFQRALELELKRVRRYQYALTLALFGMDISSTQTTPPGITGILRARAGNALLHSIRDIDMATELDQDRFLVLLPYTDLTGATEVARRIIGAVGAIAPLRSSGGEFQVRLVGAIAGTKPGQQLSFAKLIRDAQRALEAARRDGAELAVQP